MVDTDAVLKVLAVVLLSVAALVGGLFVFATVDPSPRVSYRLRALRSPQ